MASFFSKIFGKSKSKEADAPSQAIKTALDGIIEKGMLDLSYDMDVTEDGFAINFTGPDSHLLTSREGQVLDGFQTFLKRLLQNRWPLEKMEVTVDSEGFLESSAQDLRELAEKLKRLVLDKGYPSYVRALPPRDRKVVHRYLAEDSRVKSQSVGEGFCKKIKISSSVSAPQRRRHREYDEGPSR